MMTDQLTFIIAGILAVLALVTPLCSAFFRRPPIEDDEVFNPTTPLSVIIPAHNMARELERHIPLIMSQHYQPGFEVIVVNDMSDDDTDEVLQRFKADYPNLHTTYVPDSNHYVSRRKLAITLGVKAAKNEWIILTEADCYPATDHWLQSMAGHMTDDADALCAYTNYEEDTKGVYVFHRLLMSCYLLNRPYRYEGANMAFRKSAFMSRNGFLHNLMYLRGEYDFLVNDSHQVNVTTAPESRVIQSEPAHADWLDHRLHSMETRRHLAGGFIPRLLFNLDMSLLHLNYVADIAAIVCSAVTANFILLGVAVFCLLLSLTVRTVIMRKAVNAFDEHIATYKLPLLETAVVWQNIWYMLKHKTTDKYDYIRK